MPRRLRLRDVTAEEAEEIRAIAHSRTLAASLVQRARLLEAMLDDPTLPAGPAGRRVGYKSDLPGRTWVKRYNAQGIAGLEDHPRSGCPRTHSEDVRSHLLHLALTKPRTLDLPFELWTLERLQTAFRERHGIHLSDSTIWTWVQQEGLVWKRQQSWFGQAEQHDPEFAEKRGPSSRRMSTCCPIPG